VFNTATIEITYGDSRSGVDVQLEPVPAVQVSGRISPDAGVTPPPPLVLRLMARGQEMLGFGAEAATSMVKPDGTFTFLNVPAGEYGPVDLTREAARAGITITLTDRRTELSGTLTSQAAAGAPVSDVVVIVYSTERQFWTPGSRRIRAVHPGADGRYAIKDLPPGEYLISAVTDAEPDEWYEREFLDRLTSSSVRVTIADGEKKVQNLSVSRQE
jgi:hypothetical protein